MKMKLSEFLETVDLFGELNLPYLDAPVMNALLAYEHGRKTVFEKSTELPIDVLAKLILAKFETTWELLISSELLLAGNLNQRIEVSETVNKDESKTGDRVDTNKVSAFNSDVMIENDGSTSLNNDSTIEETTKVSVSEKIDPIKAFNLLTVKSRDTIMQTVISDVSSFLTLSVY